MEAVIFEDALFIADITLPKFIDEVILTFLLLPALSVIDIEPSLIPVPPFKLETKVAVFKSGFKSVAKTSEPGIVNLTFVPCSI